MSALDGKIEGGRHRMQVRVYYEDTDFTGIVYHANYLRFMERGRTNYLRLLGADQHALFFGCGELARVSRIGDVWRAELKPSPVAVQLAYEGPSLPQAKREASKAIRLFMCREVDEATVLGKRVKRGRVRR